MKQKFSRDTITYGMIALLVFALIFTVNFRGHSEEKSPEQPQIVAFGDSVFGLIRDDTSIPALLQKELGVQVFNGGFGGSCAAKMRSDHMQWQPINFLSLSELTEAVWLDDFSVPRGTQWRESEYFPEVIEGLAGIDFTQVETVLLQHGFNDYHAGVPIDNEEDSYDEYSYLGALRSSVRALRRVNPELRIVLVTPSYAWYVLTGVTCEEADYGGGLLEEYVNAQIGLAEELDLEVVDVYHGLYESNDWSNAAVYTNDGLHPNEYGRELIAAKIAEVLQQ